MQLYSLNATKSFYVSSRDTVTSCVSASRSKVTATYLPKLPATQNIAIPADIILRINHALPVEISCSTIRGAQKYIWDLPFGAIIDSGFNSRKIKVVFSAVHYNDTVRVSGYNGCIGQSKTVIWKKDSTPTNNKSSSIQLQNYLDDWDVVIFPNPSHSTFTLKMQNYQGGQFECKVVDLLGNLIDHGCWNGMSEITLGRRWRAGIYFLEVYHSGKVIRKKMVKI
jgi:hypothetical protein